MQRQLQTSRLCAATLGALLILPVLASAHEGHEHELATGVETGNKAQHHSANATTGSGNLQFKYHPELSQLPEAIAKGIRKAHGGFGKAPNGEVYFGLNGTGLIRVSADLKTKTLVSASLSLLQGGLHNCAYVDRDGGSLVLPDNQNGRILIVKLDGSEVKTFAKPDFLPAGKYAPTDADIAADGNVYICDGYGASKTVFTLDLDKMAYGEVKFGGIAGAERTEGKFSTNHGVTFDPTDNTLIIADRERQWAQKLTCNGKFIEGYDMDRHNPCDVDFVEFNGKRLMIAGCLTGPDKGVVQILRDGKVVSTLKPKLDLGLEQFNHVHNAAGVVVNGKLFILCYGWNPGCYAVLEHITQ